MRGGDARHTGISSKSEFDAWIREDAMAKTMKAAMVRKFKEPLPIEEVPVPEV